MRWITVVVAPRSRSLRRLNPNTGRGVAATGADLADLLLPATFLLSAVPADAGSPPPLVDAPVLWYEADRAPLEVDPEERSPNLLRDQINATVSRPVSRNLAPAKLARRVGTLFGGQLFVRP